MCHCGAVVKELLARADKSGSTPGDAVFCFLVVLFVCLFVFVWSLFFNNIFPLGLFSFTLTADPAGHALGSIYIFSISAEFYFGKGFRKLLICILGQTKKKHNLSRHVPPLKPLNFFSILVKLTFCTSS